MTALFFHPTSSTAFVLLVVLLLAFHTVTVLSKQQQQQHHHHLRDEHHHRGLLRASALKGEEEQLIEEEQQLVLEQQLQQHQEHSHVLPAVAVVSASKNVSENQLMTKNSVDEDHDEVFRTHDEYYDQQYQLQPQYQLQQQQEQLQLQQRQLKGRYEEPSYWERYREQFGRKIKRCKFLFNVIPKDGTTCRRMKVGDYTCLFGETTCPLDDTATTATTATATTTTHPTTKCDCIRHKWHCGDYQACVTPDSRAGVATCPAKHPASVDSFLTCQDGLQCSYGQQTCCGGRTFETSNCACGDDGRFKCQNNDACEREDCSAFAGCPVDKQKGVSYVSQDYKFCASAAGAFEACPTGFEFFAIDPCGCGCRPTLCGGVSDVTTCIDTDMCVDDPTDQCDPTTQDDCGGICVPSKCEVSTTGAVVDARIKAFCRTATFSCPAGTMFFFNDACGCGCEPVIRCGGGGAINAPPCKDDLTCVDDRSDRCDPRDDDDCPGICLDCPIESNLGVTYYSTNPDFCATATLQPCDAGLEFFSSDCGCGCQPQTCNTVPCETGSTCIDDPHDDCDPENSGIGCNHFCLPNQCPDPAAVDYKFTSAALCQTTAKFACPAGMEVFSEPACGCGCRTIACDGFTNKTCPDDLTCIAPDDCNGDGCLGTCTDCPDQKDIGTQYHSRNRNVCIRDQFQICNAGLEVFSNECGCGCKPTICGGFTGVTCEKGSVCVDDPSDDCKGGSDDCVGICLPDQCPDPSAPNVEYKQTQSNLCETDIFVCPAGFLYFFDVACGCGCIGIPSSSEGLICAAGTTFVDDPSDDCEPASSSGKSGKIGKSGKKGSSKKGDDDDEDCPGICVDCPNPNVIGIEYFSMEVCADTKKPPKCGTGLTFFTNDCGCGCEPILCISGKNACKKGAICVDNPADDCNPAIGGINCAGLCVPDSCPDPADPGVDYRFTNAAVCETAKFDCPMGTVFFSDAACGCGCETAGCGGMDGIPCATGLTCIDDATDTCEPGRGNRNCPGVCAVCPDPNDLGTQVYSADPLFCANANFEPCFPGLEFFSNECGCGCQSTKCGGNTFQSCGRGSFCVNDPSDDCDPRLGDLGCGGICVPNECPDPSGPGVDYKFTDIVACDRQSQILCPPGTDSFEFLCGCGCKPSFCGGRDAIPCVKGFSCLPNITCDPRVEGAVCGGICLATRAGAQDDPLGKNVDF